MYTFRRLWAVETLFVHPGIPPPTFAGSGVHPAEPDAALDDRQRQTIVATSTGRGIREITVFSIAEITVTP